MFQIVGKFIFLVFSPGVAAPAVIIVATVVIIVMLLILRLVTFRKYYLYFSRIKIGSNPE